MAVVLTMAAVGGCRGGTPPTGLFEGRWSGAVVETGRGAGSLELTLSQQGATLSGALRMQVSGIVDRDGPVVGVASGTSASITYVPKERLPCGFGTLSGTLTLTVTVAGDRVTGTYTQFTCSGPASGSIDASRGQAP